MLWFTDSRGIAKVVAAMTSVVLIAACTPDPDDAAPTNTETTQQPETPVEAPTGISDECEPVTGLDIPTHWPGPDLLVVVDGEPLTIDASTAIAADCLMLASAYSAGMDIPIPELGTVSVGEGTLVDYVPPTTPGNLDDPDRSWWGEDRIRVCAETGQGRPGCTNIDVQVVRADVARLAERFAVTTRPTLMSPLTRAGMRDEGVSPGGVARLQDAYAAEWALQLIARTIELPEPPIEMRSACEITGNSSDDLWEQGRRLLENFSAVADLGAVELTTTMGQEPPADLSATANEALRFTEAWLDCAV